MPDTSLPAATSPSPAADGPSVRSASVVAACTLLSRVLGLVREILAARIFGLGWIWDAFAMAFQVPNLFRRLFGEGALSAAFVPVFAEHLQNGREAEARRLMGGVVGFLAVGLGAVAAFGIAASHLLPGLIAGRVDPENARWFDLFFSLLAILLPYLPLICLVAILTAILNVYKHFTMPALAAAVLNVVWVGAFLVLPGYLQDEALVRGLCWAIVAGGVLELAIQIPPLMARRIRFEWNLDWRQPGMRQVGRLMGPTVFGLAVVQFNLLLDSVIAQACVPGDGAVSALYYANRLLQFPLALIGTAMGTVAFPFFADHAARKDEAGLAREVTRSLGLVFAIGLPATVGLAVLAEPICALLFQGDKFTAQNSVRAGTALLYYASGVWAFCGLQIVVRAFYALQDTVTPVRIGMWTVGLNLALNLTLVWSMQESGIALATTITAAVNLLLLCRRLGERLPAWRPGALRVGLAGMVAASAAMGATCWLYRSFATPVIAAQWPGLDSTHIAGRAVAALVPIALGALVYFAAGALLGVRELREFWRGVAGRKEG